MTKLTKLAVSFVSQKPSVFSYFSQLRLIRNNDYKNIKVVGLLSSSITRNDICGSNEILNSIYSYNAKMQSQDIHNRTHIVIRYEKFSKMLYNCLRFNNNQFVETFYLKNKDNGKQSNLIVGYNEEIFFNRQNIGLINKLVRNFAEYNNEQMFVTFLKMASSKNIHRQKELAISILQFKLKQNSDLSEFWINLDTFFMDLFEFQESDFIFLINDHYSVSLTNFQEFTDLFKSVFFQLKNEKTKSMFLNYFVKYFYLSKNKLFNLNTSSNYFMKLLLIQNFLAVESFQNLELNFLKCCLNTDFGYHSAMQILKYLIMKNKLSLNVKYFQFLYKICFRKLRNLKKKKSSVSPSSTKQIDDTIIYLIRRQLSEFSYIDPISQLIIKKNSSYYLQLNFDSIRINEKQILDQPLIVNPNDLYNFEKRSRYNFEKLFKC